VRDIDRCLHVGRSNVHAYAPIDPPALLSILSDAIAPSVTRFARYLTNFTIGTCTSVSLHTYAPLSYARTKRTCSPTSSPRLSAFGATRGAPPWLSRRFWISDRAIFAPCFSLRYQHSAAYASVMAPLRYRRDCCDYVRKAAGSPSAFDSFQIGSEAA